MDKKANGVYYTPSPIVDYVVKHTLSALLERSSNGRVGQASNLRILDPACGDGSFLIGAYQLLLNWYCDRYIADGADRHTHKICEAPGGWQLTVTERLRILREHIYGVELDPQAVEIAKQALLRKALETGSQTPSDGLSPSNERCRTARRHQRSDSLDMDAPPDLASNIKCGNALIGPDFYNDQSISACASQEQRQINVFDWHVAFAPIMKAGGFHALVGNPPWGQKAIAREADVQRYLCKHYPSTRGIHDLFRPFVEKSISLIAEGGMVGMVLPDIVLLKDYMETRRYLLNHLTLEAIDWWGRAFPSAVIDAATIIGSKRQAPVDQQVRVAVHDPGEPFEHMIPQADFRANPRFVFNLYLTPQKRRVLKRLDQFPRLGDYFEIHEGVHSGNIRHELFVTSRVDETCREFYFGRDEIRPFSLHWQGRYLHLAALPAKKTPQRYANLGRSEWHEQEKVLVRRTGDHILAAVDKECRYASNNFFLVFPQCKEDFNPPWPANLQGLCALLNSQLMTWFYRTIEPRRGRVFAELKIKHLRVFPLPLLTPGESKELNRLGESRAKLAAALAGGSIPEQTVRLQRQVARAHRQIDRLVYKLFKLTREEIKLVEERQANGDADADSYHISRYTPDTISLAVDTKLVGDVSAASPD